MNFFEQQIHSIINQAKKNNLSISGITSEILLFLLEQNTKKSGENYLWFASASTRQALQRFTSKNLFVWDLELHDPTDQILNHEGLLNLLITFYEKILLGQNVHLFIPWELAEFYAPPLSFFQKNILTLKVDDIIPRNELKNSFLKLGYKEGLLGNLQLGEFCFRGDVCDCKSSGGNFYRIIFFDDLIESIYEIDPNNNRTVKSNSFSKIDFMVSWRHFLQGEHLNTLRQNLPIPTPKFRERYEFRKNFFESLNDDKQTFNFYYYPLFFPNTKTTLIEQLSELSLNNIFLTPEVSAVATESLLNMWSMRIDEQLEIETSPLLLPKLDRLFSLEKNPPRAGLYLANNGEPSLGQWYLLNDLLKKHIDSQSKRLSKIELFSKWFIQQQLNIQKIIFAYTNVQEKEHLENITKNRWLFLKNQDHFQINWILAEFPISAFDELTQTLIVSAKDFVYAPSLTNKTKTRHVDLFAEHLSTLKEGDFVVHQGFGIGKFLEMQNMTIAGQNSDFIVLKFLSDDKVYVPVYKMNLLEKYADAGIDVKLSDLRTKKFEQEKLNARASAKKLAFDLIRLEAERKTHKGFAFSPPDEYFEEFEASFPYTETPDQAQAIAEVIDDMCKPIPMDRLICGDVGFGKTEVAMRAAFKAILDKKQVVVLVPTTILCLQHFNNFKKRFSNFGVQIEQLSRLVSAKQNKENIDKIKNGTCDLVIATHKILSKDVSFKDLGLVIVDEEHRFGVGDKEKLKLLRANIDFLTLTATPIPRTLQLAFLGIKPLSLIQTPPPERQSIQTSLIREDWETIGSAIKKEIKRHGQVFYIYNRVMDIEIMASKIREIVPSVKLVIAHGQLNEKELEKRIQAFYEKEYDLLLATTIVESGIDIPIANTMIIHNAHQYGLAQLHQLRGRIGRSNNKAYCYFVVPDKHKLTDLSSKRLEALQKYCDVGAGFALANSDLEIRGAGELLGAEQSGHIQSIGLELYLSLLEDAMNEIKGEKNEVHHQTDVHLGLASYIPQHYIPEESARIKFYKKLANAGEISHLEQIQEELIDIYGALPEFVNNLVLTLKIRLTMNALCLKHLSLGKNSLHLKFELSALDKKPTFSQALIKYFMSKPKLYRFISPTQVDYIPKDELTPAMVYDFCQNLKDQFIQQ